MVKHIKTIRLKLIRRNVSRTDVLTQVTFINQWKKRYSRSGDEVAIKLLHEWKLFSITAEIPGKNCNTLKGSWVPGAVIELPCIHKPCPWAEPLRGAGGPWFLLLQFPKQTRTKSFSSKYQKYCFLQKFSSHTDQKFHNFNAYATILGQFWAFQLF